MADISKIKMPDNQSYDLKDAEARQSIDNIPFIKGNGNSSAALKGTLGNLTNSAEGQFSVAEGVGTTANGTCAHAEGLVTYAGSTSTHAEGGYTAALGQSSHAEGQFTLAIGSNSHAEGTGQGSNGYKITGGKNATTYTLSTTPTQSLINAMIVYKRNYATIIAIDTTNNTITLSNSLGNAIENEQCIVYFGYAIGLGTHTEGFGTIANALGMHAMGAFNVPATLYDNWTAGTAYSVGDRVTKTDAGFICLEANSDETWTSSKWKRIYSNGDSIFTIGNGTDHTQRSNALAVDIDGNAKFNGNIYVGCNADSTGGTRLPHDVQINGTSVVSNGIANIPVASNSTLGVVKCNEAGGIGIYANTLYLKDATSELIKEGTSAGGILKPKRQHEAVFYGLSKVAGVDLANETVTLGTYPTTSQAAIRSMIGAVSSSDVNNQISTAIGNINSFDAEVVQTLPTENIKTHTIYFVPKTGETNDVYDEYIRINNAWEMIGNTQIDLSNYVQKTDYATSSVAGVVKVDPSANSGIQITNSGLIATVNANANQIKEGIQYNTVIPPARQHISVFYGLAKAAGDSTQSSSSNAVGTYTSEAKTAIQQMLDVPNNSEIVFVPGTAKGSVKLKDFTSDSGTTYSSIASGFGSHAEGLNATASGGGSHAEGQNTIASGSLSHAEGMGTEVNGVGAHAEGNTTKAIENYTHAEGTKTTAYGLASHAEGGQTITRGDYSHVEGYANVEDNYDSWVEWQSNTQYIIGNKVKKTSIENGVTEVIGYICKIANNDLEFNNSNWDIDTNYNYIHIVGNGKSKNNRSNAYALDWEGNGHYAKDIYINCNNNSTGGEKLVNGLEVVKLI